LDNLRIIKAAVKAADDSINNAYSLESPAFTTGAATATAVAVLSDILTAAVYEVKLSTSINKNPENKAEALEQATNTRNALISEISAYSNVNAVADINASTVIKSTSDASNISDVSTSHNETSSVTSSPITALPIN